MANLEEYVLNLRGDFMAKMKEAENSTNILRSGFGSLAGAIGGALATFSIAAYMNEAVGAWNESEQAVAQVRQGLETTAGVSKRTLSELEDMAAGLQKVSLFDDDVILRDATSVLLTFTNITGDAFDRTQKSALDLSTRMGGDLKGASMQLGKALNDPVEGLSALTRSGVSFSESQKATIKKLTETGHLAQAQGLILNELEHQFGGSAAAAAAAGTGPFVVMQHSLGDINERVGGLVAGIATALLPTVQKLISAFGSLVDFVTRNATQIKVLAGVVAAGAIGYFAYTTALSAGTIAATLFSGAMSVVNVVMSLNPVGLLIGGIVALVAAVYLAYQNFEQFRAAIQGVGAAIKQFVTNAIASVGEIPNKIIAAFKAVPKAIFDSLKGAGNILGAIASGNFSEIPAMLKQLGGDLLKTNPLASVAVDLGKDLGKGVGGAFNTAYDSELKNGKENTTAGVFGAKKAPGGQLSDFGLGGTKTGKSGVGSGLSEIKAAAPKNFNINIGKLVETLSITTANMTETKNAIKDEITRALLAAVNDSQIISTE